ncbi:leucine-rich repeat-containing protein 74A [Paramormyrops kingsleyae]|uniref:leucine-rich repeat-containing protein 74A n=1 Tax=Paramormyrops kingsleyae TaxID=1676925 RepID=UPI003B96EBF6
MMSAVSECRLFLETLRLEESDSSHLSRQPGPGDEWDTDLDTDEDEGDKADLSPAEIYQHACRVVGVVPVSYYLRNLSDSTLNLNHRGLGPLGVKALAIALASDVRLTTLELKDNYLLAEGTRYIVEMLKANVTIQNLNLSNNHLQTAGAECITKFLVDNISIQSLKLSGNGFKEDDAKYFADTFSTNYRVKELDLSHNDFSGKGGEHLGQLLASNEGLETLDLSWNHLRMKGAVALSAGLKGNITLKHLDLSWNGFGNEGALALGEALKYNNTLVLLNLSHNRITNEGAEMLCKGLEANDTLHTLRLAYNTLTVEGALALLNTVKNSHRSALEEINISNVLVNENFVRLLEVTRQWHPGLEVHYGGVGGFMAKKPNKRPDPMKVIQDYLDERKLRLWDFFRNIDKDGTMRVPVSDFRRAVQQSTIPLDRHQIEELIQKLDKDRTGLVDYRGLADTRKKMMRDHRRQLRKVESRQKKEKQKSERILKTFQSAVEAVTPRSSVVMSPGGAKEDSSGPQRFLATPLSSWHHVVMSNSGHYSVTNMSNEHFHLPSIGGLATSRPPSSPSTYSYSRLNLQTPSVKLHLDQVTDLCTSPDVMTLKLSPTTDQLTRSRPALSLKESGPNVKTTKAKKKKSRKRGQCS